nr:hypothetical protein [Phenylobacterium sp.]
MNSSIVCTPEILCSRSSTNDITGQSFTEEALLQQLTTLAAEVEAELAGRRDGAKSPTQVGYAGQLIGSPIRRNRQRDIGHPRRGLDRFRRPGMNLVRQSGAIRMV